MKPRIGIFGGSFNPIHVGHIAIARQLLRLARLDEVWFLVSPLNPFKTAATDLLDDDRRLLMAQQALEGDAHLKASDYEFRLPKPSYTYNTLQHLKADYPDNEFVLIIGADNWLAFDRWAHPDYILSNFDIAVYARPDCPIDSNALPFRVHLYNMGLFDISSTLIRARVHQGLSVTGMVPAAIEPLCRQFYSALE